MIPKTQKHRDSSIVTPLSFDAAIDRVKVLLKDEGFGVLCEIDVTATLREKIGEEFRRYRILGTCNPKLAFRALSTDPRVGALLPCNVVVEARDGRTIVSAVDAEAMLAVVDDDALAPIAAEVNERLGRVLEGMRSASDTIACPT
jgi:uncharacterized protein (DUF302 family)